MLSDTLSSDKHTTTTTTTTTATTTTTMTTSLVAVGWYQIILLGEQRARV